MSRTSHELNKAKRNVLMKALALRADPENLEKRLALVEAIDDLERDRATVQGGIVKALLGVDHGTNLLADDSITKATTPKGAFPDSVTLTERIRKSAGATPADTDAPALNILTNDAKRPVPRINAPSLYQED